MSRFLTTIWLVPLVLTAAPPVRAQSDSTPTRPEVRTTGVAERSARPDLAVITFSFSAPGRTPMAAGQAVAARAERFRRALQALGIPRDSLISGSRWYWWRGRIDSVFSGPRYVPMPRDPVTGAVSRAVVDTTFRANDAIEVRIRDLSKVGAAIDTALAHGITTMSGIRFQATDIAAAREEALREATQRAQRQAAAIAEASGGRLGRALSLSSEPEYRYDRYALDFTAASYAGGSEPAATQVVQPSIPVRVTVYGRWELLARP